MYRHFEIEVFHLKPVWHKNLLGSLFFFLFLAMRFFSFFFLKKLAEFNWKKGR